MKRSRSRPMKLRWKRLRTQAETGGVAFGWYLVRVGSGWSSPSHHHGSSSSHLYLYASSEAGRARWSQFR